MTDKQPNQLNLEDLQPQKVQPPNVQYADRPTQFADETEIDRFLEEQTYLSQNPYQDTPLNTGVAVHNSQPNSQSNSQLNAVSQQQLTSLIGYNHLIYLMFILSFFSGGLLSFVAVIMSYLKRQEAQGTWLDPHFDWQIKTFWYALIIGGLGVLLIYLSLGGVGVSILAQSSNMAVGSVLMALLGGFLIVLNVIWSFYRVVRGWIALADKRPVP